jgi:toxin YoeB
LFLTNERNFPDPRQRQQRITDALPALMGVGLNPRRENLNGCYDQCLIFSDETWEDYPCLQKRNNRMVERINKLIQETRRDPFIGVGKPEALKHALSGYCSRRITDEHGMVYPSMLIRS